MTLSLDPLFTDNAVLPRDVPLPIFGRAVPGQTVKVALAGKQTTARADDSGVWVAQFPPMPAGGPHVLGVSLASKQLIRRDILIGDIWLAAGQACMSLALKDTPNVRSQLGTLMASPLRFFVVPQRASGAPEGENQGRWEKCARETTGGFSAIAFHFARMLQQAVECPIGIVQVTWAETLGLHWVPPAILRARGALDKKPAPNMPTSTLKPGEAFNGMLAPLQRMPVKGVISHHGETEVEFATQYRATFANMVEGWRDAWRRPDLPFIFVQLGPRPGTVSLIREEAWAEFREAQAYNARLPATAMVVSADIGNGDEGSINNGVSSRVIGERLAVAALGVAYKRQMPVSGPEYWRHTFQNGSVQVEFAHAESGLRVRAGCELDGFMIAGSDRCFHKATARIEGSSVVISHPGIPAPQAVRYGWESRPTLSLENGFGLPAIPFRTDNWASATRA